MSFCTSMGVAPGATRSYWARSATSAARPMVIDGRAVALLIADAAGGASGA